MALTVPAPTFSQPGTEGNLLAAEKPIELTCGPVTFPDGTPLKPKQGVEAGFLLYRDPGTGMIEVWDEQAQTWSRESDAPRSQALFFEQDRWQSILVTVGEKFGPRGSGGFPRYFVRCFYKARDDQGVEHLGESPPSQEIEILEMGASDRAGLTTDTPSLDQVTTIRLFLKDATLVERGRIGIRSVGGGFAIEIELLPSGARLALTSEGDIALTPAAGRSVRVAGDLYVHGIKLDVP